MNKKIFYTGLLCIGVFSFLFLSCSNSFFTPLKGSIKFNFNALPNLSQICSRSEATSDSTETFYYEITAKGSDYNKTQTGTLDITSDDLSDISLTVDFTEITLNTTIKLSMNLYEVTTDSNDEETKTLIAEGSSSIVVTDENTAATLVLSSPTFEQSMWKVDSIVFTATDSSDTTTLDGSLSETETSGSDSGTITGNSWLYFDGEGTVTLFTEYVYSDCTGIYADYDDTDELYKYSGTYTLDSDGNYILPEELLGSIAVYNTDSNSCFCSSTSTSFTENLDLSSATLTPSGSVTCIVFGDSSTDEASDTEDGTAVLNLTYDSSTSYTTLSSATATETIDLDETD